MASSTTRLMNFDQFEKLPDPREGRYELHHGELVTVPPPQYPHIRAQWQLRRLLEKAAGTDGFVDKEVPYRPLPENEYRVADVVYMPMERWNSIEKYLFGAPDLVVEVLSPSNNLHELREKRALCLENGSREFWVVDPRRRDVEVTASDGRSVIYKAGQTVPLFFALGATIAVDSIFE